MQIEILNVGTATFTPTPKGGYSTIEVAYKQDGKVKGKKLVSFNASYDTVKNAQPGEIYTITESKNAKGYLEWTNATKGSHEEVGAGAGQTLEKSKPAYGFRENDEKRQRLIVRQSCLSNAIATLNIKGVPNPDEVLALAERYVSFIFDEKNLSDIDSDIPQ